MPKTKLAPYCSGYSMRSSIAVRNTAFQQKHDPYMKISDHAVPLLYTYNHHLVQHIHQTTQEHH